MYRRTGILSLLILLGACAAGGGGRAGYDYGPISWIELDESGATSVMEAVRILRPSWIPRLVSAYVDGREMPEAELDVEPIENIAEIRFLTGAEATARLGVTPRSNSAGFLQIFRRGLRER